MRFYNARTGIVAFLLGTAILLVALVVFSRYPAILSEGTDYRAEFRSVAGLNRGGEVRYGGVLVGTVTSLDIDPQRPTTIVVQFRVRDNTPVREDTRAAITQVGLLGEQYLNLEPGSPTAPPLPEGSTIASIDNLSFQDAMNRVARFLVQADTLFGGLDRLAKSSPLERLDRTLTRLDQILASAGAGSERVFVRLDDVGAKVSLLVARTERLLAGADSALRVVGPGLNATQQEAVATLRETRAMVAMIRDALTQEGGVDDLVRNLSHASENLARLSERLERDPTSVLKQRELPRKIAGPPIRD
jgi:phospholipid/cholesterol/gamma-HCH transport system substrate-binding protein